jgi:hypothetical protein
VREVVGEVVEGGEARDGAEVAHEPPSSSSSGIAVAASDKRAFFLVESLFV